MRGGCTRLTLQRQRTASALHPEPAVFTIGFSKVSSFSFLPVLIRTNGRALRPGRPTVGLIWGFDDLTRDAISSARGPADAGDRQGFFGLRRTPFVYLLNRCAHAHTPLKIIIIIISCSLRDRPNVI